MPAKWKQNANNRMLKTFCFMCKFVEMWIFHSFLFLAHVWHYVRCCIVFSALQPFLLILKQPRKSLFYVNMTDSKKVFPKIHVSIQISKIFTLITVKRLTLEYSKEYIFVEFKSKSASSIMKWSSIWTMHTMKMIYYYSVNASYTK